MEYSLSTFTNKSNLGNLTLTETINKLNLVGFEVDEVSLLKYICSFRNENHFHEEICETIYSRLMEKFTPTLLVVKCLYTRRGGIDICPIRANRPEFLDIVLTNPHFSHEKTTRQ